MEHLNDTIGPLTMATTRLVAAAKQALVSTLPLDELLELDVDRVPTIYQRLASQMNIPLTTATLERIEASDPLTARDIRIMLVTDRLLEEVDSELPLNDFTDDFRLLAKDVASEIVNEAGDGQGSWRRGRANSLIAEKAGDLRVAYENLPVV
jgi:hypothetical protein